jgi:Uma2 family endonuclease
MALEIVSPSSVEKDTEVLRDLYGKAGVNEYWLVEHSNGRAILQILRYTKRGYVTVRPQDGWIKSPIFGKSFRLVQRTDQHGLQTFKLAMR